VIHAPARHGGSPFAKSADRLQEEPAPSKVLPRIATPFLLAFLSQPFLSQAALAVRIATGADLKLSLCLLQDSQAGSRKNLMTVLETGNAQTDVQMSQREC